MTLTIVICTHNRVDLLEKTLESLNAAERPAGHCIEILVIANACTDSTISFLTNYQRASDIDAVIPLRWEQEPQAGKSYALNLAIGMISTPYVAFVDDDHRIDTAYLKEICAGLTNYPEATLYCGRILPDWDGSEPGWVHDRGPYRIYPLPVPRFDHGESPAEFSKNGPIPGGGNLIVDIEVFKRIGVFSTALGPSGHNLGGGEDSDFVIRALSQGERLQYLPQIIQYHYVDHDRLTLRYILAKSYQRSRSVTRISAAGEPIPNYLWRKLFTYSAHAIFSLSWQKRRFYLVRLAAAFGELRGYSETPTH